MTTFSQDPVWVDVTRFKNSDYLVCDETVATYSPTSPRALMEGDLISASSGAIGNIYYVSGNTIKFAQIAGPTFSSGNVTVTVGVTPYNYSISIISTTHGSHNLSLQELVNRDKYLYEYGAGNLQLTEATLYLKNVDGDILSNIDVDINVTQIGQTLYTTLAGYTTSEMYINTAPLSPTFANHYFNYTGGTLSLMNSQGTTMSEVVVDGIPIGSIMAFATTSAPTGWLECNGAIIKISTYPVLANAIWVGADRNAPGATGDWGYRCTADGKKTSTGEYIKLPDLRGRFARGFDNGASIDTGRIWTENQEDAFKMHAHTWSGPERRNEERGGGANVVWRGTAEASTGAIGGLETRPKNTTVLYCIKAFSTIVAPGVLNLEELANDINQLSACVGNKWDNLNCPAAIALNGQQKFNNGLTFKWGQSNGYPGEENGTYSQLFDSAFSNTCLMVLISTDVQDPVTTGDDRSQRIAQVVRSSVTVEGFTWVADNFTDGGDNIGISYFAIGY